jgi:hypothetical protein
MRVSGAKRRSNSHEKEKTHTPEEIIKNLCEAEGLIAAAATGKREYAAEASPGRPDARHGDLERNRRGKMVAPARKREAVVHVRQSLNIKKSRACLASRQPLNANKSSHNKCIKFSGHSNRP